MEFALEMLGRTLTLNPAFDVASLELQQIKNVYLCTLEMLNANSQSSHRVISDSRATNGSKQADSCAA